MRNNYKIQKEQPKDLDLFKGVLILKSTPFLK